MSEFFDSAGFSRMLVRRFTMICCRFSCSCSMDDVGSTNFLRMYSSFVCKSKRRYESIRERESVGNRNDTRSLWDSLRIATVYAHRCKKKKKKRTMRTTDEAYCIHPQHTLIYLYIILPNKRASFASLNRVFLSYTTSLHFSLFTSSGEKIRGGKGTTRV